MPYNIRKLPNKNKYKVYNIDTGKIFSYSASLGDAEKQVRLLRSLDQKKRALKKR